MEGSVCGLIATSHQFARLGVCHLSAAFAPVILTLESGDETPVNRTCTSMMPSGACVNLPTMSSPVCPNSVAVTDDCNGAVRIGGAAEEEPGKLRPSRSAHIVATIVLI